MFTPFGQDSPKASEEARRLNKELRRMPIARDENIESAPQSPTTEGGREAARTAPRTSKGAAIDMRLFSIPLSRVVPDRWYEVRLKRKRTWKRALLSDGFWIGEGPVLGRVEDTVDVRIPEEEVTATIDWLASTMARLLENEPDPGARQYYIDRDVLDGVDELLGHIDLDHPTAEEISICRAIRLAAAAKATPSVPHSDIAVGYRVTDHTGHTLLDSLILEDALLYIDDNRDLARTDVAVVFADGSVCHGHELSRRPWISGPDDFRREKAD